LLAEIAPHRGANQNIHTADGTNVFTRTEAAAHAGLSKREKDTYLRIATLPKAAYAAQQDSPKAPLFSGFLSEKFKIIS
jgi:hypothetical protein